jgi:hypothetical protein
MMLGPGAALLACWGACAAPRRPSSDAARDSSSTADAPGEVAPGRAVDAGTPVADAAADSGIVRTGGPLPAGVAPARRLLETTASLTGGGSNSCSHQEPASGDGHRWCAFSRPGATAGMLELWVIDVSEAAAGRVPRCDGSDPGCRRLTETLWTAFSIYGPAHPFSHAFEGDTLVFYVGVAPKADSVYRGTVYGWRPGWPAPRALTSDKGLTCSGHPRAPVAFCIENVMGDPSHPDSFEAHAGSIADPAGPPLPSAGVVHPFRSSGGDAVWGWNFSADGALFAVASPDPDPAVASIRAVPTRDVGRVAPVEVVRDATHWAISGDARKVYFTREDAAGGKSLWVSDFPVGSTPVKLSDNVQDYVMLGDGEVDRGVGMMLRLEADHFSFRLVRDRDRPTESVPVFTALRMIEGVTVSRDLRYTGWVSAMFQSRVVRNEDGASCLLNTTTRRPAYWPRFLASAKMVFWEEDGADDGNRRDGFYGNPQDCSGRTRYAHGLDFYHLVGDRGIVYGDELDGLYRVTLKYAAIGGGQEWPAAGPVRVHEHVKTDKGAILAGTNPALVVFEVAAGNPAEDGLYVFGPLPF